MGPKLLYTILIFFAHSCICRAQGTGCFKATGINDVGLETNMGMEKYSAFFVGELHGVYGTIEIKLALIKYLNIHYGITDVFMETGFSTAYLYNRYLATGDTTLFTAPLLVYAMKQANRDFWKSLYRYNNTATHKITIHGMDFERNDFLKALKMLMPAGKERPQQINTLLTYIDTVTVYNVNDGIGDGTSGRGGENLSNIYDSVRKDMAHNRFAYRRYYGAAYKTVETIMFNENTYRKYAYRNKAMYHNMMREIKDANINKFVTFNGLRHGNKAYTGSLYYLLAKNRRFKNKITNMAMVCKNCYDWQFVPRYRNAAFRAPYTYQADSTLLNSMFSSYFNPACKYTPAACKYHGRRQSQRIFRLHYPDERPA